MNLIPNKKKVVQQRGRAITKTERMISQIRWEIKTEKKLKEKTEGKEETTEKKEETKEIKPVAVPPPKRVTSKSLDAEATKELLGQLRQKLKIPDDKQLTWSYLEYDCVYKGIKLNEIQKKALRTMLTQQAEQAVVQ